MKIKRKGASLIIVVTFLAFIAILGVSLLALVSADYKMRIEENRRVENLYASESGLDVANAILVNEFNEAVKSGNDEVEGSNDDFNVKNDKFKKAFKSYLKDNLNKKLYKSGSYNNDSYNDLINNRSYYKEIKIMPEVDPFDGKETIDSVELNSIDTNKDNFTLKLTSNFKDKRDKDRRVSVSYTLDVPDYGISPLGKTPLDNNPLLRNLLATDSDMTIDVNDRTLNLSGLLWAKGKKDEDNEIKADITNEKKYVGGITIKNSGIEKTNPSISGQIRTAGTFKVENTNLKLRAANYTGGKADYKTGIYAENLYLSKTNNNVDVGLDTIIDVTSETLKKDSGDGVVPYDVNIGNDMIVKGENIKANFEKGYYGLNDLSKAKPTQSYRQSSSIILDSKKYGEDGTKLTFKDNLWLAGVGYLKTDINNPYKTAESVGFKGNYSAYTKPQENSIYGYIDPVQVIMEYNKNKLQNDSNSKQNRKEFFDSLFTPPYDVNNEKYDKNNLDKDRRFKDEELQKIYSNYSKAIKISNPAKVNTTGALLYSLESDKKENLNYRRAIEPDSEKLKDRQALFATEVYEMLDWDEDGDKYKDTDVDFYKGQVNRTVKNQIDWDFIKKVIQEEDSSKEEEKLLNELRSLNGINYEVKIYNYKAEGICLITFNDKKKKSTDQSKNINIILNYKDSNSIEISDQKFSVKDTSISHELISCGEKDRNNIPNGQQYLNLLIITKGNVNITKLPEAETSNKNSLEYSFNPSIFAVGSINIINGSQTTNCQIGNRFAANNIVEVIMRNFVGLCGNIGNVFISDIKYEAYDYIDYNKFIKRQRWVIEK